MNIQLAAVMAVLPVAAAALLGNIATRPNIPTWYSALAKPVFNPPNWIFAPVWTLLYAMMAYAFFRLLVATPNAWSGRAIVLFLVQIALNAAWSWVFFAGQNPRGGLAVVIGLSAAIAATIAAFWQIDHIASVMLWPYLAWVGFATLLNFEIARLNPTR